ncbi:hypothetical protein ABEX78_32210 [Priestia megaterium]
MCEMDLIHFFDTATEEEIRAFAVEEGINELRVMFTSLKDLETMILDELLWVRG